MMMYAVMRYNKGEVSITVQTTEHDNLEQEVWDSLIEKVDGRGSKLEAIISNNKMIIREVKTNDTTPANTAGI